MDPIVLAKATPDPSLTPTELKEVLWTHSQSVHSLTTKIPGVYFLFYGQEIVYVGQSTHVPGRINTHVLERKMKFDRVTYLSLPTSELLSEEARYISMLRPKYNKSGMGRKEISHEETADCTTIVLKGSANRFSFSDTVIKNLPENKNRKIMWDTYTRGLCILIGKKKVFYAVKKNGGKKIYAKLGEFPYMNVKEARIKGLKVLAAIASGKYVKGLLIE